MTTLFETNVQRVNFSEYETISQVRRALADGNPENLKELLIVS